jgi:hypothetical protein
MAFYVKLQKEHEDDTSVIYRFGLKKKHLAGFD